MLQFLSGAALVFARDIEEQVWKSSGREIDITRLDKAVTLAMQDFRAGRLRSVRSTGVRSSHVDVIVSEGATKAYAVRIDTFNLQRKRITGWDGRIRHLGFVRFLARFHKELLAGAIGHIFIGLSGLLLFSNALLGAALAWPVKHKLRIVLFPKSRLAYNMAALYAWHRALGMWSLPFLLVIAGSGSLLVWWPYRVDAPVVAVEPRVGDPKLSSAVKRGMSLYPDSSFVSVEPPIPNRPLYVVRLRQRLEPHPVVGNTYVWIDLMGRVEGTADPLSGGLSTVKSSIYSVHTAQIGGFVLKAVFALAGLGVSLLILLGLGMFLSKRSKKKSGNKRNARSALQS